MQGIFAAETADGAIVQKLLMVVVCA